MATNDNFLTEVQEELSRENIDKFFKKYGTFIFTALLVFVVSVAVYQAWKFYDVKSRTETGDKLYKVISNFDDVNADKTLAEVEKKHNYREVAALISANLQEKRLNPAGIEDSYKRLANDKTANPALRQLAELNLAGMKLSKDPVDISGEKELIELSKDGMVFKYSALEMLASYYKKAGRNNEAKATFRKLAEDETTPPTLSSRAKSMMNSF